MLVLEPLADLRTVIVIFHRDQNSPILENDRDTVRAQPHVLGVNKRLDF